MKCRVRKREGITCRLRMMERRRLDMLWVGMVAFRSSVINLARLALVDVKCYYRRTMLAKSMALNDLRRMIEGCHDGMHMARDE